MALNSVLFAYNGRVETDGRGNYFGNELNDQLVERYRFLGKQVTFLVRKRLISEREIDNLLPFVSRDFKIIGLPEFNSLLKFVRVVGQMHSIIEKAVIDTDIIVARLPSTVGRLAIKYAKKYAKPYIIEVVGCPWDALWNHSFTGKLLAPYAYFALRNIVANAPYVMYVTEKFLQKRYPNKHTNIGLSDVVILEVNPDILEHKRDRYVSIMLQNEWIIGTAAALDVPYKSQTTVLEALYELNKKPTRRFRYFLVGKGRKDKISQKADQLKISEEVTILGQLSHNKIFNFFDSLDIYIQPSKQEGLPRAMVEAMSRGCLCIGTRIGGIPELIPNKFIFRKGDYKALARILSQLNKDDFLQALEHNQKMAAKFFPDNLNERRNTFFNGVLQNLSKNFPFESKSI